MPQPQPGADRPAEGSTPAPDQGRESVEHAAPTSPAVPPTAAGWTGASPAAASPAAASPTAASPTGASPTGASPTAASGGGTGPEGTRRLPDGELSGGPDASAPAAPGEPAPDTAGPAAAASGSAPEPPAPTRVERPRGSAAVPSPPPRRPAWGESAEPTPVPPTADEPPEHRTPVDPWAGVDTGGWELDHPEPAPLPPTLPYPAQPAPHQQPSTPRPPSYPPTPPYPQPAYQPAAPQPTAYQPGPAHPPTRAYPVSPAPAPPAKGRSKRSRRPEPAAPPPGWQPPQGYVPVPVRRRRRWPWFLLFSLLCCCGVPAWFGKPMWEQYPADAALPAEVADLTLRSDARSDATVKRLKAEVRSANLLAEDVFAGIYATPDGKRVTVFGDTGFRFSPETDANDEISRLTGTYRLGEAQPVDTGVRGRYERCAVGQADGAAVVVCTSVDHGSSATAVFTRLSVDDSARLLAQLREQIVTPQQG